MLREIPVNFATEKLAKLALTKMRKDYCTAFRGSVACPTRGYYRLWVNLSGSGFTVSEFGSAVKQFGLHISEAQHTSEIETERMLNASKMGDPEKSIARDLLKGL